MSVQPCITLLALSCKRCWERFYICHRCYRGQSYCSDSCRYQARRQQLREANRRYRRSIEARLDHRDRQRDYRRLKDFVRDQSSNGYATNAMIATPFALNASGRSTAWPGARRLVSQVEQGETRRLVRCRICGRAGTPIEISSRPGVDLGWRTAPWRRT
jgi:hypothetical protein